MQDPIVWAKGGDRIGPVQKGAEQGAPRFPASMGRFDRII